MFVFDRSANFIRCSERTDQVDDAPEGAGDGPGPLPPGAPLPGADGVGPPADQAAPALGGLPAVGKGRGKGRGRGGAPWPSFDVHSEEGATKLGEIKWGAANSTLSAHCLWCNAALGEEVPSHGLCRLDRTTRPSLTRPAQGRPLGFLVAWLRRAPFHETREAHFDDRLGGVIDLAERQAARAWAEATPGMAEPLSKERDRRPGEGPEPDLCP